MSNIQVVGLGALNIDHLYRVERILDDGEAVVNESTLSPGGSAANTIYGLAKLGVNTGFAGVVGNDAEGKLLLKDFQAVGVDTSQIRVKPRTKTGSVLCLSDSSGKRSLYILPGANNLLTMDDLDLSYINQAKVLHLSSFADDRQFKVLEELITRLDSSVKVSFAPGALYATKGMEALAPILARTHVLFINQDEIQQLTGMNFETGAEECLKPGCQMIVATLGKGLEMPHQTPTPGKVTAVSYIRDTNGKHIIEASNQSEIAPLDTTGAGDAFATGFLYGLLWGKGLEECGHLGDIIAQFSIGKIGARQGLPVLKELSQRYRELYGKEL
ncbi:carbohydrate kinase family protein [Chloroflexota bacterium]